MTTPDELIAELEEALTDMTAGWRYIRVVHGELYGVGWERCQNNAMAALSRSRSYREMKGADNG